MTAELVPDPIDILVCDVSFIRLQNALPKPLERVKVTGKAIILIKPQFQLPKALIGDGIVTDSVLHAQACDEVLAWFASLKCWKLLGLTESPLLGGDGNKEFLLGVEKDD